MSSLSTIPTCLGTLVHQYLDLRSMCLSSRAHRNILSVHRLALSWKFARLSNEDEVDDLLEQPFPLLRYVDVEIPIHTESSLFATVLPSVSGHVKFVVVDKFDEEDPIDAYLPSLPKVESLTISDPEWNMFDTSPTLSTLFDRYPGLLALSVQCDPLLLLERFTRTYPLQVLETHVPREAPEGSTWLYLQQFVPDLKVLKVRFMCDTPDVFDVMPKAFVHGLSTFTLLEEIHLDSVECHDVVRLDPMPQLRKCRIDSSVGAIAILDASPELTHLDVRLNAMEDVVDWAPLARRIRGAQRLKHLTLRNDGTESAWEIPNLLMAMGDRQQPSIIEFDFELECRRGLDCLNAILSTFPSLLNLSVRVTAFEDSESVSTAGLSAITLPMDCTTRLYIICLTPEDEAFPSVRRLLGKLWPSFAESELHPVQATDDHQSSYMCEIRTEPTAVAMVM